jgi:hypothetical protein
MATRGINNDCTTNRTHGDRLKSSVFPELELTAEAIFSATSIT